ncbi:hypothetical protein JCM6882_009760, partial [Rhodosporidiobolus microsporus]
MASTSPSTSRASLPLPATPSTASLASPGGGAGRAGGSSGGPTVRVLSSQEDLATRPRSTSRGSISVGMGRTGSRDSLVGRGGSAGGAGGAGSTGPTATAGGELARATSPTPTGSRPSTAVPGVLPSAAFLNPRIPTTSPTLSHLPSSPTLSDSSHGYSAATHRPLSAASTATTGATGATGVALSLPLSSPPTSPRAGRQQHQGPIITRVSSAMAPSPASPVPPSPSISSSSAALAADYARSPSTRPTSPPAARRTSTDDLALALSPEEVAADLAAGGRLAQQRRSSADLVLAGAGAGAGARAESAMSGAYGVGVSAQGQEQRAGEDEQGAARTDFVHPQQQQSPAHHVLDFARSPSSSSAAAAFDSEKPFSALPPRPPSSSSPHLPAHPSAPRPTSRAFPAPSSVMLHIPLIPLTPRQRVYALHPGHNRFPSRGRLLSSGDNPLPFVVSCAVAFVLPALWWAFNGDFLWTHLGGGGKASLFVFAYLVLVMWTSMLKTALSDPGILPRDLDPHPARKLVEGSAEGGGEPVWRAEAKYVRVKGGGVVGSKWCETCHTYRPPRTSHCRLCDNCVEHTDHHCAFLNNCIGRRNYLPFLSFLASALLSGIYSLCFSAWHVSRTADLDPAGWTGRWDAIGAIVVAVLSFGLLVPVAGLASYHARLVWTNRTTVEM